MYQLIAVEPISDLMVVVRQGMSYLSFNHGQYAYFFLPTKMELLFIIFIFSNHLFFPCWTILNDNSGTKTRVDMVIQIMLEVMAVEGVMEVVAMVMVSTTTFIMISMMRPLLHSHSMILRVNLDSCQELIKGKFKKIMRT